MKVVQDIWHGESEILLKRFYAKRQIASIIVDPPFGTNNKSKQAVTPHGKAMARKIAYDATPEIAMDNFTRIMHAAEPGMKDESDIYIFTSHQVLEEWLTFTRKLLAPMGFSRKAILTWQKDGPGMGDLDTWGMGCEFILYYKRGARMMTDRRRNPVLAVPQVAPGALSHPHEKPEPLLEMFIKHSTSPGDLVVDPCGGSGSLARAARNTGRSGISIELDELNYNEAMKRFREVGLF